MNNLIIIYDTIVMMLSYITYAYGTPARFVVLVYHYPPLLQNTSPNFLQHPTNFRTLLGHLTRIFKKCKNNGHLYPTNFLKYISLVLVNSNYQAFHWSIQAVSLTLLSFHIEKSEIYRAFHKKLLSRKRNYFSFLYYSASKEATLIFFDIFWIRKFPKLLLQLSRKRRNN